MEFKGSTLISWHMEVHLQPQITASTIQTWFLDMKIALISDIHGDLEGLQLALNDIQTEKIDAIFCLGDMIHGSGFDEEVVKLIRAHRIPTITGNHELKEDPSLSEDTKTYISGLPERIEFNGTVLSHASPLDWKKITCTDDALPVFQKANFEIGFVGHTHFPFVYSFGECGQVISHDQPYNTEFNLEPDRRYLICVGALGDQRTPRVPRQYTIFNTVNGQIRFKTL